MEMCQRDVGQAFASQGRPAPRAKSAPGFPRRGIELKNFAFGNRVVFRFEGDEYGNRRASVSSTTLAVTPIHACRFTGRGKTDRATKATALELLGRIAHGLILARP